MSFFSFFFQHWGLSLLIFKALENDKQIKLRDESIFTYSIVPYIFHLSFYSVCLSLKCWFTCHRVITLLALNFYQRDTLNQIRMNNSEIFFYFTIELFNLYFIHIICYMSYMFVMFCDVRSTFIVYFLDLRLLKFYKMFDVAHINKEIIQISINKLLCYGQNKFN